MNIAEAQQISNTVPTFSSGRKLSKSLQACLWELLQNEPECPTSLLLIKLEQIHGKISVGIRHVNRLRAAWGLSREKGRPRHEEAAESGGRKSLVRVIPNLPFAGVHIFDDFMTQSKVFDNVIMPLKQGIESYKEEHPNADFPLLDHRDETLMLRFKALFYAPLFDIGKLTEFDYKEHALETVIGRGYQSSTLNQFLGQLERIDAADYLMPALVPASGGGEISYIDGHTIPYWSKSVPMHKGKITMLGRIMPGSNAVVAHNEDGHAIYIEYYPLDKHMSHMIVEYYEKVVAMTGITVFVIDREINSLAMARAFESKEWGLLSMLDRNEYKALSDWTTEFEGKLDDGGSVYSGEWNPPRPDDPRRFVIVEQEDGKLLPFWGTPEICRRFSPMKWAELYSQRTEIQENSFKSMKDHGALDTNYGIKKITGPDRHQARAIEKADATLKGIQKRVEKKEEQIENQQNKIKDSENKEHNILLPKRKKNLTIMENDLKKLDEKNKKAEDHRRSLGEAKERSDRDFRKQRIMTFRTLLLENALMAFLLTLLGNINIDISLETLLSLVFKRGGTYIESASEVIYKISTAGLSIPYRETLEKIVEGLNSMNLERNGKSVRVELREAPT